jgi:hypothetical protein
LFPSGLLYTRCLGRTNDYKKQVNGMKTDYSKNMEKNSIGMLLTWKPEIQYIRSDEVLWLGIFSESISNNISL